MWPHMLSTTMSSAQFPKAVLPHSCSMFLRLSASMRAGPETTFLESHELDMTYGRKGVCVVGKQTNAQSALLQPQGDMKLEQV